MPCTQFYRELDFGVPLLVLSKATSSSPEGTPGLGWVHVDPQQRPPLIRWPQGPTWKGQQKTRRSQQ